MAETDTTPASSEFELGDQGDHSPQQLPPVDGGKDAWLFLAASFVVEALVWGKLPVTSSCVDKLHLAPCIRTPVAKQRVLTPSRVPVLLRRLPGLLLLPRAFCRQQQRSRHRNMRHGEQPRVLPTRRTPLTAV